MVAEASIGKLFLGGIIPGLIMAVVMMIYIYFIAKKRGYPTEKRERLVAIISYFIKSFLPLLTPLILIGFISFGLVTVTEAAVVAVLYSCFLGMIVYRALNIKGLYETFKSAFVGFGSIAILFPAAKLFGFVITIEDISTKLTVFFTSISSNPIILILMINLLFLILGCFSDALVNIILFVPAVLPIALAMGMDPIHFGVMIVFNVMIGLITPPMGSMLFIVSAITKVPLESIIKESWPFVWLHIAVLLLLVFFPSLITFLPNLLMK
jgi:tripartite ATP-independent transporter DctM subunit